MKRIYSLIPEGENAKPILVVADNMGSAFGVALVKLTDGCRIVAVQEGPEVEIA